jgi:hypothetical protein
LANPHPDLKSSEPFEIDMGFDLVDHNEVSSSEDLKSRLERVEQMVIPFLDNLAKDPHKDIHWPDRDVKIKDFKRKFLSVIHDPIARSA